MPRAATGAWKLSKTVSIEDLGDVADAWQIGGPNYLPYRIALLAKMLDRHTTRLLQESAGLTLAEWRVLSQLTIESPAPVRQLASQAWVDRAEVSRAAASLERRGYVERQDNPADRRSTLFSPTPQGIALVETIRPLRREFHAALTRNLSKAQRAVLDEALLILACQCVTALNADEHRPEPEPVALSEAAAVG